METDRDSLEQLAEEFSRLCRGGERPSIDDYAQRHPELAHDIRELFPMLVMMELAAPQAEETGQKVFRPARCPHGHSQLRHDRKNPSTD